MEPIPKRVLYFQVEKPAPAFAEACLSLTPKVSVVKGQEIFLEISTTSHLFGGESGIIFLARNLAETFKERPNVLLLDRAEWARSCAVLPEMMLPPGEDAKFLHSLCIERLEHIGDPFMSPEEAANRRSLIAFMRRVGMRTVGDFARLSYLSVGRRFGKDGIVLQEWVCGVRELVLPDFVPEAPIQEALDTDEIGSLEALLFALRATLVRVESRLVGRALVARQLKFTFTLDSGERIEKLLELSEAGREATPLLKLLREFLAKMHWETPLTRLELEVSRAESFTPGQLSLLDNYENRFADLAGYVERLRTRFGREAVGFPALQESYLPESSWTNTWPPAKKPPEREHQVPAGTRPLFLFMPSRPWQKPANCRLIPSENLAGEWWTEDKAGDRQYYIAETSAGEKLWAYWDTKQKSWFLQGTFD